ncbi:MAG: BatA and WFA domain-containing protein, partial [Planctomycetia bacterium]|nr:BatA and WFA domain-containing protein [Planctomycetia bacterium]
MLDFIRRTWFPTALVVLLVLALPGWLLFCLHLFGLEGDVNRWLQDNLSLSYQLMVPWWAGLLLLLIPFALVILYFLKLKRKPIQVPSTFLWKKSIEDLHVNSLLQWLRHNVLLLLQLLVVLLLPYAVMSFRFHGRNTEGRHYIIMIDNSASMSCTDVAPNRLEWAKQEALKEIDAAGENDYGMVIAFNSSAQTLQSRTSNRDLLRQAVKSIGPTQRTTRIEEALSLADSLANPSRSTDDAASRPPGEAPDKIRTYVANEGTPTEVHLYSDGRFPDVPRFALGNLRLQLHIAGQTGAAAQENIGIVKLNAYRDESDPTRVQIFCRVINTRAQAAKGRVQIDVQTTGQVAKSIYEKPLLLPPRIYKQEKEPGKDEAIVTDTPGEASVTFDLKDLDDLADITVHARLLDVKDNFPLDDEAWLVLGVVRKARILVVSRGNEILDKFFNDDVLKDVAVLTRLKPDELAQDEAYLKDYLKPAHNGDFDLVIFDRWAPKKEDDMPRGNTFFVGQPPPGWKKPGQEDGEGKPVEKVANPSIKGWMTRHPILRYLVALQEVGVAEAFKLKDLPPRTPLLIESDRETA